MTCAYRIRLGGDNRHTDECYAGGYIGVGYGFTQDFTGQLAEDYRDFNRRFRPEYLKLAPGKSKIAAGQACGTVWTVCKGMKVGDLVLCPDSEGFFHVGRISGEYQHDPENILPQQRPVQWLKIRIEPGHMSEALLASCGARGTVVNLEKYVQELERLISTGVPAVTVSDESIQDPVAFAMERHLEAFLIENWSRTELGRDYDIYTENGEILGQQFQTDTGFIDILAISKDRTVLLVIELKKAVPATPSWVRFCGIWDMSRKNWRNRTSASEA